MDKTKLCNGCRKSLALSDYKTRTTPSKKTGLRIRKGWTSKCKRCINRRDYATILAKARASKQQVLQPCKNTSLSQT